MADIAVTADRPAEHRGVDTKENLLAGILAGITGAILMALWSMGYSAAQGLGFFLPMRLIAATLFGVEALVGDAGVLLVGMMIHLATAGVWGALFALLLPRHAGYAVSLFAGLVWGLLIVLIAMTFLILPWVDPIMRERVALTTFSWIVTHLIYGVVLGLLVPFLRLRLA
jgi:hypothetical protein